MFCYWFDQAVFKNSYSGKNLSDIKKKKKRLAAEYKLVFESYGLYANDATCIIEFY